MTYSYDDGAVWRLVADGFLARIAAIFNSMMGLIERGSNADGQVLLRVLYDHCATFCWIGIDPEVHVAEWHRWDEGRYRKLHNDARKFGVKVLDDEDYSRVADAPDARGLAELAEAIDRYWPDHIMAFRPHPPDGPMEIRSFRGLYASIFRKTSGLVHSTEAGLGRHTRIHSGWAFVSAEEQPPLESDLPAVAAPLTAFVLLVYRHHFDFPDIARADTLTQLLRTLD